MGPFVGAILASLIYNYVLCPQRLSREERLAVFKGFFAPEDNLQQPPGNRADSRWNSECADCSQKSIGYPAQ
ncbi:Aquaporin-2, partial [Ophiophagus hannah]